MIHRVVHSLAVVCTITSPASAQTNTVDTLKARFNTAKHRIEGDSVIAYSNSLSNTGWQLRHKGDLDGYLALQAEQKRFCITGNVDAGTTNANDAVSAAAKRVVADRDSKLADLMGQYVAKLEAAIKELVVSDRIEDAKAAKAEAGKITFEKADLESRQTNISIKVDTSPALPPLDLGRPLRGDVRTDRDREFVELKVDGAQVVRDMCWNPTNKNVLVLNKRGQLRQISVPDIKETALLELNAPTVKLQQSLLGLHLSRERSVETDHEVDSVVQELRVCPFGTHILWAVDGKR